MIEKILRVAAWLVLVGLALATLVPLRLRPQTALDVDLERAIALALVACLWVFAYPKKFGLVAFGLFAFILGLEFAQTLLPDRHGRMGDALVKVFGALAGVGIGGAIALMARAWRGARDPGLRN